MNLVRSQLWTTSYKLGLRITIEIFKEDDHSHRESWKPFLKDFRPIKIGGKYKSLPRGFR